MGSEEASPSQGNIVVQRASVARTAEPTASGEGRRAAAQEFLALSDAVRRLQAEQRDQRLEKDELRFERDRYRASAAALQKQLTAALDELDQMRISREEVEYLKRETLLVAREFEERDASNRRTLAEVGREFEERLERMRALTEQSGNRPDEAEGEEIPAVDEQREP